MILSKEERVERYPNGKIDYMETIGWVATMFIALYPNHRVHPDKGPWVRIGVNRKYWEDGRLQWEILYDDHGNVVKG
jgi:hypothetical protein